MKSLLFLVCAVLLVGLLVAGCTNKAPVPTSVTIVRILEPTTSVIIATTSLVTDPALLGPWLLKAGMKNNETLSVISNEEPTITFTNDGTFTVFGGCNCYKENYILTGQTTEFRKTIRLRPVPQTAMYCAQINYTETNYLQILQATETYYIRNNIEYLNLRTAAGEQLFYRSGNL